MTDCTCATPVADLLRAAIEGRDTSCPEHSPAPTPEPEAPALNSDHLAQSIAARLGVTIEGAPL